MEIKRNLKTLENKTGAKIVTKIKSMIGNHDKYKGCYFWSNTGNASNRRKQEFSEKLIFNLDGTEYKWIQDLEISCKNFYWTSSIFKNSKKSNIKAIKNLI